VSEEFGLWRLTLQVLPYAGQQAQPLLASGTPGNGNLLLLEYVDKNVICFANDEWNYGLIRSPRLAIDPDHLHTLEVFVGPQVAKHSLPPEWKMAPEALAPLASRLKVWIDGRLAWDTTIRGNLQSYNFLSPWGKIHRVSPLPWPRILALFENSRFCPMTGMTSFFAA